MGSQSDLSHLQESGPEGSVVQEVVYQLPELRLDLTDLPQ
ncbi:hypothetical protein chiPu_0029861, partial [Chiloscyllium punctatum]|nr:hypothetical protein [Chiloscyllium punctatum]